MEMSDAAVAMHDSTDEPVNTITDTGRNEAQATSTQEAFDTDSMLDVKQDIIPDPRLTSCTHRLQRLEASAETAKRAVASIEVDETRALRAIDSWEAALQKTLREAATRARSAVKEDAAAQLRFYQGFLETAAKEVKAVMDCKDVCDSAAYFALPPRSQMFLGDGITVCSAIKDDCEVRQVPRFVQERARALFDDLRVTSNLKRAKPRDAPRPPCPQELGHPDANPSDKFPVILRLGITLNNLSGMPVIERILPWLANAVSASVGIKAGSMALRLTPVVLRVCPHRGDVACAIGFPLDVPKGEIECFMRISFSGWESDKVIKSCWW
jgi:hypothetical protein